jgi:hypothetical protein
MRTPELFLLPLLSPSIRTCQREAWLATRKNNSMRGIVAPMLALTSSALEFFASQVTIWLTPGVH